MLTNLIITALSGAAGVILLEKWEVDDYMNTHPFWSVIWPEKPCLLCRAFWIGFLVYLFLLFVPGAAYVALPFAAIPLQVLAVKLTIK